MVNRHLIRSTVLQALFEADFNNVSKVEKVKEVYNRLSEEFVSDKPYDMAFPNALIEGVLSKRKELDKIIIQVAPEWPLEKIAILDRNIIRLGLFELLFGKELEIPSRVAINEAIELAKEFAGENSGRFVNGVLGAVYKEMDEEDKISNYSKQHEKHIGVLVYAINKGVANFALLHDVFGKWTLAKEKLQEGENAELIAEKTAKDELGLVCKVEREIGSNSYTSHPKDTPPIRNEVTYFVAKSPYGKITLKESGGLDDAKWFTREGLNNISLYKDLKVMILKTADEVESSVNKENFVK